MATTITANGINFPDGSAGSPSIGGSDTNTGLFTGSDIVGFATGGSERLKIDASGNVNIANDSGKLRLGASNDLQIYHSGTQSYVTDQGTGNLNLQGSSKVVIGNAAHDENMAQFFADGAVELYHNNSLKFETTSSGTRTTGAMHINDGAADGNRISVGNGGDLKIFHTNPTTFIQDSSTALVINSARLDINNAADSEQMARFNQNGAVELYYDNSKKLETTSTGANLYGHLLPDTADTHDLGSNAKKWSELHLKHYLYMPDAGRIRLGSSYNMQLFYDGSHQVLLGKTGNTYITAPSSQSVRLGKSSADNFSAEQMVTAYTDGAVELYYDNSKKLETTTEGFKTQGTGQATVLIGSTDGSGAYLLLDGDSNGDGNGGDYSYVGMTTQGVLQLHNLKNEDLEFATNAQTRARFTSSGHFVPQANNTYDLGSTGARWANVYTNDLNLSNEGGANDVDGTWGSYTIQEGAEDLFLVNKRNGKKYKFALTEVS